MGAHANVKSKFATALVHNQRGAIRCRSLGLPSFGYNTTSNMNRALAQQAFDLRQAIEQRDNPETRPTPGPQPGVMDAQAFVRQRIEPVLVQFIGSLYGQGMAVTPLVKEFLGEDYCLEFRIDMGKDYDALFWITGAGAEHLRVSIMGIKGTSFQLAGHDVEDHLLESLLREASETLPSGTTEHN